MICLFVFRMESARTAMAAPPKQQQEQQEESNNSRNPQHPRMRRHHRGQRHIVGGNDDTRYRIDRHELESLSDNWQRNRVKYLAIISERTLPLTATDGETNFRKPAPRGLPKGSQAIQFAQESTFFGPGCGIRLCLESEAKRHDQSRPCGEGDPVRRSHPS